MPSLPSNLPPTAAPTVVQPGISKGIGARRGRWPEGAAPTCGKAKAKNPPPPINEARFLITFSPNERQKLPFIICQVLDSKESRKMRNLRSGIGASCLQVEKRL